MTLDPNRFLPDPFTDGRAYVGVDAEVGVGEFWAMEMDTTFAVRILSGAILQGMSGDYLCKDDDGQLWPIDRLVFMTRYRPADPRAVLPPQVAHSENEDVVLLPEEVP